VIHNQHSEHCKPVYREHNSIPDVAYETERLIAAALYHRRPVYIAFPADAADIPMVATAEPAPPPKIEPIALEAAANAIVAALNSAKPAYMLPGILIARAGLKSQLQTQVYASGLPFATMFMAKSVLDEQHPLTSACTTAAL
jgi:indolepyruvate decarboxylase